MGPNGQETGCIADLAPVDRQHQADSLAEEFSTFTALRPSLLSHVGHYVLIKGTELVGIYPTLDEVEEEALRRYGPEPYFIEEIRKDGSPAILNILAD